MKNLEHTPGSWFSEIDQETGDRIVLNEDGIIICQRPGPANARLIAACPRMYDYIESRAKEGDKNAKEIMRDLQA